MHMLMKCISTYCNLICALWLLLLSKMYITKVFACLLEMAPLYLRVNESDKHSMKIDQLEFLPFFGYLGALPIFMLILLIE